MKRRKHPRHNPFDDETLFENTPTDPAELKMPQLEGLPAQLALWSLRLLLRVGGVDNLNSFNGIDLEPVEWRFLGLPIQRESLSPGQFRRLARRRLELLEQQGIELDGALNNNLEQLGERLGLSDLERQLLLAVVMAKSERAFEQISGYVNDSEYAPHRLARTLAVMFGADGGEVAQMLGEEGMLFRAGLLKRSELARRSDLESAFELLDGFESRLFEEHADVFELLKPFFVPLEEPELKAGDFRHRQTEIDALERYLQQALASGRPGATVLIYGPPGTGKTQLARLLARRLEASAYEVSTANREGEPIGGGRRLSAYALAQAVLEREHRALLLFDEIEDVFERGDIWLMELFGAPRRYAGGYGKGWMNRSLETAPVPSIWISNGVQRMDPAVLRRFDFVLELGNPPQPIRRAILQRSLPEQLVSERWLDAVSEHGQISPALMATAARVVQDMGLGDKAAIEQQMTTRLNAWCRAMGFAPLRGRPRQPLSYRPDLINTDPPIQPVIDGLCETGFGRLCLWGPPGTGKTALGRHIAERLQRPLLVRRASMLLDKFVGETEKRIADMFREAEMSDAVLLLDEADSLLRRRDGAEHSWEVTQVNELLTQMEDFEGLFICSTNLMDALDEAALRRFDLKIHFASLRPEQARALFRQALEDHDARLDDEADWPQRLERLDGLTPGDFATALRRLTVARQPVRAETLYQGLEAETRLRQTRRGRPIGFNAVVG